MPTSLLHVELTHLKTTVEYNNSSFKQSTVYREMHEKDNYLGLGGEDPQESLRSSKEGSS